MKLLRQARDMAQLEAQVDRMLAAQASQWVQTMKRPGVLDRIMFARWLKRNERHASEYLAMEALEQALNGIDPQRQRSVEQLLAARAEVVAFGDDELRAGSPARNSRRRVLGFAMAATVALAAIATGWFALANRGWQEIRTAVGEQRVVELKDGSTVFLNTQSHLRFKLSPESRELSLVAGEALFKVERDPLRPFTVHADGNAIRAIGTQFNVHRKPQGTEVAVLEGRVEITGAHEPKSALPPMLLTAGEEARIETDKPVAKLATADIAKTMAWRQRRLMFRLDALGDIAAEFNRYNRLPQIRIEGDAARVRRFSGVFDADDPQAFANTLSGDTSLDIARTNDEILIRARP